MGYEVCDGEVEGMGSWVLIIFLITLTWEA